MTTLRDALPRALAAVTAAALAVAVTAPFSPAGAASGDGKAAKRAKAKIVLEEDFRDDDHGWGGGVSDPPGSWEVRLDAGNGVLLMDVQRRPSELNAAAPEFFPDSLMPMEQKLVDVRMDAIVTWVGPAAPAILCRTNADDLDAYGFALLPDGNALIVKRTNDGIERLAETTSPAFDPATAGSTDLTLRGDCVDTKQGVQLTLGLDGKKLLTAVDSTDPIETGGLPSLTVFQPSTGRDGAPLTFAPELVAWDAFVVSRLG